MGDFVAAGEAGLAARRVGWTFVRGALNEVRTSEHGTHLLSAPAGDGGTSGEPQPNPTGRSPVGHDCP